MYFENAMREIEAERAGSIESNPVFEQLRGGKFTRAHYLAYLKETYHLVAHTPLYLKVAAARCGGDDGWLRDYYLDFANDETGHELLCVHDIRALGEKPEEVLAEKPLGGSWAMITQNHYLAASGNPVSLIGDIIATEGLGANLATSVADLLEKEYDVPHAATTFLRVHGDEDVKHIEGARKAMEQYGPDPAHYADIVHTCRMTLHYYGQLFSDVLEQGHRWAERFVDADRVNAEK